jgi:hypothetical protein
MTKHPQGMILLAFMEKSHILPNMHKVLVLSQVREKIYSGSGQSQATVSGLGDK